MSSKSRVLFGEVVSNKMDKSVVVKVTRQVNHPLYKKIIRKSMKVIAHDEANRCQLGQLVSVVESPRFSKRKAWLVVETSNQS